MSVVGVHRQNSWSRSLSRRDSYEPGSGTLRDDRGWTPLHVAARVGDLAQVQRLLDEGADVNTPAWGPKAAGTTPLHLAAIGGHLDVMDELLERGANIEARTKGGCGWTPLHSAAKERNKRAIRFLLENGAFLPPDLTDGRRNVNLYILRLIDGFIAGCQTSELSHLNTCSLLWFEMVESYKEARTEIEIGNRNGRPDNMLHPS
ncbi:hypothetical protein R1flu_025661 [Riccia fluitans]|uniref:Uncharacterized protein n=1 Tax=Riccia fluitans TaxID=41844 RepID=A0ABD1XYD9_9MARC